MKVNGLDIVMLVVIIGGIVLSIINVVPEPRPLVYFIMGYLLVRIITIDNKKQEDGE